MSFCLYLTKTYHRIHKYKIAARPPPKLWKSIFLHQPYLIISWFDAIIVHSIQHGRMGAYTNLVWVHIALQVHGASTCMHMYTCNCGSMQVLMYNLRQKETFLIPHCYVSLFFLDKDDPVYIVPFCDGYLSKCVRYDRVAIESCEHNLCITGKI